MLIELKDYAFVESVLDPQKTFIRQLSGPFKDVIIQVIWLKLTEDQSLGMARLSFNFEIEKCPTSFKPETLKTNPEFITRIGDTLSAILSTQAVKIGNLENGTRTPSDYS